MAWSSWAPLSSSAVAALAPFSLATTSRLLLPLLLSFSFSFCCCPSSLPLPPPLPLSLSPPLLNDSRIRFIVRLLSSAPPPTTPKAAAILCRGSGGWFKGTGVHMRCGESAFLFSTVCLSLPSSFSPRLSHTHKTNNHPPKKRSYTKQRFHPFFHYLLVLLLDGLGQAHPLQELHRQHVPRHQPLARHPRKHHTANQTFPHRAEPTSKHWRRRH
mmetsp:Transcript_12541/g.25523  ORF Transcript_12541/g.25523 Transcript_12541/m.25523 type:complete len:214 (+) Transcript_12541:1110-1751(+)